ncbi:unnamed protein product [Aspergillus oryzae RIB40]|uniref:DNA, SC102 n=1 Tax=Aspergillus oryzae (strain ATCC 42149 / RIB 40) TaxID=510516 RepID=Q2U9V7_ASPOR|nr:unnamed protein product [Aspergillus oryzae RIB40]BAE61658.1 unnamed protein product [Aspergillus oryzae RIB40]
MGGDGSFGERDTISRRDLPHLSRCFVSTTVLALLMCPDHFHALESVTVLYTVPTVEGGGGGVVRPYGQGLMAQSAQLPWPSLLRLPEPLIMTFGLVFLSCWQWGS